MMTKLFAPFALATVTALVACGPAPSPREDRADDTHARAMNEGVADAIAPLLDDASGDVPPVDEAPVDEAPVDEAPVDEPALDEPDAPAEVPPPDDEDGGGPPADTLAAPACAAVERPARPASCPFGGSEVVVWGQEGWNALGDAMAANLSPCTDVFISAPPVTSDKTKLRAGQAALMRERGPQMHLMAEFHFTTWKQKKDAEGLTWLEVGRRFRDEMAAQGYCVEAGDTWAINEAPSTIRNDAAFRDAFANLLQGLAEGRPGMPFAKGALFITGMGQKTENTSVYKANLKTWLQHASWWVKANNTLRFFGQEVYVDPTLTCLGSSAAANRRQRVNEYAMHWLRLANAGPDSVNTAQSFLSRTYVPTMNAVWGAEDGRGYGDTTITLANMQRHVRQQVDAARSFAESHTSPDGRVGFAFGSYSDPQEWDALGTTIASAVRGAYGEGAATGGACTGEGCTCLVDGAHANTAWASLGTW